MLFSLPAKLIQDKPEWISDDTNLLFSSLEQIHKNELLLVCQDEKLNLVFEAEQKNMNSNQVYKILGYLKVLEYICA
jgi:hypothetical protein